MQRKPYPFASLLTVLTCAILAVTAVVQTQAQDKKADANGTWTWSQPGRNGGEPRVSTLKLKVDGDKLTGTISTPGRQGAEPRQTAIENGKVKGDEISFSVTREFNGNKMTSKYNGKVSADSIKGKMEFDRNGELSHAIGKQSARRIRAHRKRSNLADLIVRQFVIAKLV